MVGFDSTILPGREGSVTEEVAMSKVHDGAFTKCATVTSNAKNKPELRLCLKGVVKAPVSVAPSYITMKKDTSGVIGVTLTLTTDKADFQVKSVTFTSANNQPAGAGQNAWQTKLPIYLDFKLTKPEKPKADGSYEFKLALTMRSNFPQSQYGDIVITTNNPDALEVKQSGMIDVGIEAKK